MTATDHSLSLEPKIVTVTDRGFASLARVALGFIGSTGFGTGACARVLVVAFSTMGGFCDLTGDFGGFDGACLVIRSSSAS